MMRKILTTVPVALVVSLSLTQGCGGEDKKEENPEPEVGEVSSAPPGCDRPLDDTVAGRFYDAVRCLFEGKDAIQTGVEKGVIEAERVAVLRGRVLDEQGEPLPGARVQVLGHPEYGETVSRADGAYDLAVNGGGRLTTRVSKTGYLTSQRHRNTGWRRFENYPDVVLVVPAESAPTVQLAELKSSKLVRAPQSSDGDGERSHAVVLAPKQAATVVLRDGTRKKLESVSVRATEFTVGEAGPARMPGNLPDTSAYTYALDLSLSETEELDAALVEFDPPLVNYVDNFLDFPAGTSVPMGFYNAERDVWEASESGRVITLLDPVAGVAEVDADGDGKAESAKELALLGIDENELNLLADEYDAGDSLWRVTTPHFSTWDCNWPFGFPADAIQAFANAIGFGPEDCRRTVSGSIIGCEDQTLGEALPISGTPFSLHYQSERVPGRRDRYSLEIQLSQAEVPKSLKRIDLEVHVLGNVFKSTHPPEAEQSTSWRWDGKDAYGRTWQGRQPVEIRVGYVYDGAYEDTAGFAQSGNGEPITGDRSREEIISWASWTGKVGGFNHTGLKFGAWTLDAHHVLDRTGGMLHLGSGRTRSAEEMGPVIQTIAGTGTAGFDGDEGPALEALFDQPHGMVVAGDGTVFISDESNHRVRRISPDGVIDTYAGNGESGSDEESGPTGDGGPARDAVIELPLGLALGPDGTLYIAERGTGVVRAVDTTGKISTFAGGGDPEDGVGDGLKATEGHFDEPHSLAFGRDGALYIADAEAHRIRRVGPEGILSTVAGTGEPGSSGDNGPGHEAQINSPLGVAVDVDGTVYVSEFHGHRIRRIDSTGRITTLAGTGSAGYSGDGGLATDAKLDSPHDVQVGRDGSIYFTDEGNNRVRRVSSSGTIETIAGSGKTFSATSSNGDGGSPLDARFGQPRVLFAHEDGSLWLGDYEADKVRRIDPPLPGFVYGESLVASSDGQEGFVFDQDGRHLRTIDLLTAFVRLKFEYNKEGELVAIEDGFGSRTLIKRAGEESLTFVGPYGHETPLELDANRFLESLTDPAGQTTTFTYTDDGLLTSMEESFESGAEKHLFEYNEDGLLVRDTSPSGYFQTFERTELANGFSVERTHLNKRPEVHEVSTSESGAELRSLTDAAGITMSTERTPTRQQKTSPDSVETSFVAGDPRFGMQTPIVARWDLAASEEVNASVLHTRAVELSSSSDPLSVTALTDVTTFGEDSWTSEWDAASSTTTITSPEGRVSAVVMNNAGQVESSQLGNRLPQNIRYDKAGRPIELTQGERSFSFEYGADGLLSRVTNPLGEETSFKRNALGLITQYTLADDSVIKVSHDGARTKELSVPGKVKHQFTHEAGGLLASYEPPDVKNSEPLLWSYDEYEALKLVDSGVGSGVSYSYEPNTGRLSEVIMGAVKVSLAYNKTSGKLAKVVAPEVELALSYQGALPAALTWSGAINGSIGFVFDNQLRLIQELHGEGSASYEYDRDGLLIGAGAFKLQRSPEDGVPLSATIRSLSETWVHNDFGEPTEYAVANGATTVYARSDERDLLGRLKSRDETILGTRSELSYRYDGRGRLIEVQAAGEVVEAYSYDERDNRTSAVVAGNAIDAEYDAQDRLIRYGDAVFSYTASGDLASKTIGQTRTDYEYDRLGGLRKVNLPDGREIEYVIDGAGRRVGKKVDAELVSGLLYRDQLSPAVQLAADGTTIAAQFIYGTSQFVPDYILKANGARFRIITDQVGSVRLVVDADDGTIVQRIDYTAFGEVLNDTNPGFQPFGFAGGIYDSDTGLVRFGARDYDPSVGRWTAKDPILFGGGQTNLYGYVGNDPMNRIDPTGHAGVLIGYEAFGGIFGVAGGSAGVFVGTEGFGTYNTEFGGIGAFGTFGAGPEGGFYSDLDSLGGWAGGIKVDAGELGRGGFDLNWSLEDGSFSSFTAGAGAGFGLFGGGTVSHTNTFNVFEWLKKRAVDLFDDESRSRERDRCSR